jgi:Excalibur calcium-binding domain
LLLWIVVFPVYLARRAALATGMVLGGVAVPFAAAGSKTIPARWKNCTVVNARYHHGIGRRGAHDATSGVPVTNFCRSTRLYNQAMRYHPGLDRDKDGIACEKH